MGDRFSFGLREQPIDQPFEALRQSLHRIMPEIEAIDPQEPIAVAFQRELTFDIGIAQVTFVIADVDRAALCEMMLEAVIFDDDPRYTVWCAEGQQEVRSPGRMPGMKPPCFFRLSAVSVGLNTIAV